MKRVLYAFMLIFSITFFSGCENLKSFINTNKSTQNDTSTPNTIDSISKDTDSGTKASNDTKEANSSNSIKDYYPFKENTKYVYEGKGNEYASYNVWVDYIKDSRIQLRINNGGTELVKVIENKDGALRLILTREECYYREDFTSKQNEKDEILLKEPLVKGTSWTLSDGRKRYISDINVDINTSSGKYKALEVTTEGNDDKVIDYYALNTGLVKTVFNSKEMEVTSTLSKIQSNSSLAQSIKFYYPNVNDNKIYFTKKNLTLNTNDMTKMHIEKIMKDAPSKTVGKLLGPDAKIKSLYIGKDNIVYVDFSKELVSQMNAGAGYESLILQCITNTLGDYYGTSKVYITVENSPYSSGHIIKKKGELFTVNTKGSLELKN